MFSSKTFLYSSVSGASGPQPRGLLGSNAGWPGGEMRRHWPLRSGYRASSNALALTVVSPIAAVSSESVSPIAPAELRNRMRMSPAWDEAIVMGGWYARIVPEGLRPQNLSSCPATRNYHSGRGNGNWRYAAAMTGLTP